MSDTLVKENLPEKSDDSSEEKKQKIYTKEKLFRIFNLTLSNYSNMDRRLRHQKEVADTILIYYSLAAIFLTITVKYYPNLMEATWGEFWNLILSIVILTYSLINNSANYEQRLQNVNRVINAINKLKRDMDDVDEERLKKIKTEYSQIMKGAEQRSEVDFLNTLKQQCREQGIAWLKSEKLNEKIEEINAKIDKKIEEIKNYKQDEKQYDEISKELNEYRLLKEQLDSTKQYLSEVNIVSTEARIIFGWIKDIVLFAIPIFIFIYPLFSHFQFLKTETAALSQNKSAITITLVPTSVENTLYPG